MKHSFFFFICNLIIFLPILHGDDVINKIVAVIESKVVTSIDLDNAIKNSKLRLTRKNKKKILETLINDSLIELIAYKESILVTEEKIQNVILEKMNNTGISSIKKFSKLVTKQMNISFEKYKEQIKKQITENEIARIKISVQPPKIKEISNWYKKNRTKIGKQYTFHLFETKFRPSKNLKDELRVNNIMKSVQTLAKRNIKLAIQKYQNKIPKVYRGIFKKLRLDEIVAKTNQDVAILIQNSPTKGTSALLRNSNNNTYLFVYIQDASWVPLNKATPFIQNILTSKLRERKFKQWLDNEKQRRDIQIYL